MEIFTALINYIGNSLWNTILFLLIGVLPWIVFAFIMQLLSESIRKSLAIILGHDRYIYLTCPGVMIHEIGHAVFCIIFGHKIVEIKLFSPEDDGTLGYVRHSFNPDNLYHRIGHFFIGTGPIWFGITVLGVVSWLFLPKGMFTGSFLTYLFSLEFWCDWQTYLWLYLALSIASHITLSRPDLAGAKDGLMTIVLTAASAFLFLGWCGTWETVLIDFLIDVFFSSFMFLIFFIAVLLLLSLICKLIAKLRQGIS